MREIVDLTEAGALLKDRVSTRMKDYISNECDYQRTFTNR